MLFVDDKCFFYNSNIVSLYNFSVFLFVISIIFPHSFREMAYTKEYLLWVLLKASHSHRVIEGVKIIRARPGSVVLDVHVKYNQNLLAEEAFEVFKKAMKTPASTTRVQNILQIKQGINQVQLIPIVLGNGEIGAKCGGRYTFFSYLTPFNFRSPLIFDRGWPKIRGAENKRGRKSLAFFGWPKIKGAKIFPKPLFNSKEKRKKNYYRRWSKIKGAELGEGGRKL